MRIQVQLQAWKIRAKSSKNYEEIYTICLSGGRSAKAVNELKKYDIKAINIRGGMLAWNLLKWKGNAWFIGYYF